MTTQTIEQLIIKTNAAKRKYIKVEGENSNQRWDRVHIAKWTEIIEECDEIIAEYDQMTQDDLIKLLEVGHTALLWAHKRKAKHAALIAKYTDPDYVASRVSKK
jgi:hypothetical protein